MFSISVFKSIGLCRNSKVINFRMLHTSCIRREQTNPNDKARQKKIALIKLEMEIEKQSGNFFVPTKIEDKKWEELLQLEDPMERRSFYRYLKKIELDQHNLKCRRNRIIEKERSKLAQMNPNKEHIQYGLGKNRLFIKVLPHSITKIYITNLIHAIMFGQKIVMDMGYEHCMSNQEVRNTCDQIVVMYGAVKRDRDAFHVHFCNLPPGGRLEKQFKLALPLLAKPEPLMVVSNSSYLDHFPKEKLVYLVPNCGIDLEYNHDDVYIIGGIVDRHGQGPVSLAKAKREHLRMAQLPLGRYLKWKTGTKSLTLDQVMKILITMKNTNDWLTALKHVPIRKHCAANEVVRGFPKRLIWNE